MTDYPDTLVEQASAAPVAGTPSVAASIIVPVRERPENLVELYREYSQPLRDAGRSFEFLFVAEPWHRPLTTPLHELAALGEPIRVIQVAQTVGEAALLRLGAAESRASVLVTLPAYYRVAPGTLLELIDRVELGVAVAVARRWPRRDSWINRMQNRAFHLLLRRVAGGHIHDVACGVTALRRSVLDSLPLYGDFFRFLPILALRDGCRVEEVNAPQHPRDTAARVYAPGIYVRRLLDLFALFFLIRFTEKPLRFFGLVGSAVSFIGALVLAVLTVQRFAGKGLADRPLLLLGVLLVVLGVQAIALGLVGEIIVHLHASGRRSYRVARAEPPPS